MARVFVIAFLLLLAVTEALNPQVPLRLSYAANAQDAAPSCPVTANTSFTFLTQAAGGPAPGPICVLLFASVTGSTAACTTSAGYFIAPAAGKSGPITLQKVAPSSSPATSLCAAATLLTPAAAPVSATLEFLPCDPTKSNQNWTYVSGSKHLTFKDPATGALLSLTAPTADGLLLQLLIDDGITTGASADIQAWDTTTAGQLKVSGTTCAGVNTAANSVSSASLACDSQPVAGPAVVGGFSTSSNLDCGAAGTSPPTTCTGAPNHVAEASIIAACTSTTTVISTTSYVWGAPLLAVTAVASPGFGFPTAGSTTFKIGSAAASAGQNINTATGVASYQLPTASLLTVAGGPYSVVATYADSSATSPWPGSASAPTTVTITKGTATVSFPNIAVTFPGLTSTGTITVTVPSGVGPITAPTVTLVLDGSTSLPSVTLTGGPNTYTASVTTPNTLTQGAHVITATVTDPNFNSISAQSFITVGAPTPSPTPKATPSPTPSPTTTPAKTTPSLVLSVAKAVALGTPSTFTATLTTTGSFSPTGTVQFTVDGKAESPVVSLTGSGNHWTATFKWTFNAFNKKTHTISATFAGDSHFNAVTSNVLSEKVGKASAVYATTTDGVHGSFGKASKAKSTIAGVGTKKTQGKFNGAAYKAAPGAKSGNPASQVTAPGDTSITLSKKPTTIGFIAAENWPAGTYVFTTPVSIESKNKAKSKVKTSGKKSTLTVPAGGFSGILSFGPAVSHVSWTTTVHGPLIFTLALPKSS